MRQIAVLIVLALMLACASHVTGPDYPTDGNQKNPPPPTILQETLDVMPDTLGRME